MFNVVLTEERQVSLPRSAEEYFLEICDAQQIKFAKNQFGDYILLPPLWGRNIMLHSINQASPEEDSALRRLGKLLGEQGASVLYSSPGSLRNDLMKLLEIQIVISFAPQQSREGKAEICFFYSWKKKEESLKIIAFIIKQLARENNLLYRIASFYDFIRYFKHRKLFLTEIPTVLIQIDNQLAQEREYLENMLVAALLDIYGKKARGEQIQWVTALAEELNKSRALLPEEVQTATPVLEIQAEERIENIAEESEEDVPEIIPAEPLITEKKLPEDSKTDKALEEKESVQALNPVKKNPLKKRRKSMLYPPADGPVYQFACPGGSNYVHEYPKVSPDGPCRVAIANLDADYQKAPPKPWEYAQIREAQPDLAYVAQGSGTPGIAGENNALEDLKNLAGVIAKSEER